MRAIGAWIRAGRRRRGWSQRRLALASGLHQSTISRIETGTLTDLRWARFAVLVDALFGVGPG